MKRINSIRLRLTLWFTAALVVTLVAFGAGTYSSVKSNLFKKIEKHLDTNLTLLEHMVHENPDELYEIQAHGLLSYFRIVEDNWPIFSGGGWVNFGLDEAMHNAPLHERWIWFTSDDRSFHLKQSKLTVRGKEYQLTVAHDSEQIHRSLQRLSLTMLIGTPIAIVISLLGGYLIAGRALAPLKNLIAHAQVVNAENLSDRLTVHNPNDELGQLTTLLNDAFARLEEAFVKLKRFTQDAAHELRTPLAVLRSVGEVGLQDHRDPAAYREIIVSMLEEVDRLGRLVDGLLTLAHAESGRLSVQRQPEELVSLCGDVVECLQVLAEDKNQTITFESCASSRALIDRDMLRLSVMNLIANAIRFTPEGGKIQVRLKRQDNQTTVIEVNDNGPGIAPEHHNKIFDRFYRVDSSRSQQSGGSGLGLAIARWSVEANGGRITLQSTLGQGSTFSIILAHI